MKKIYSLLSISLLSVATFAQTYIPFNGTGPLNTNGWTTHGGTTGQTLLVATPSDSGNSLAFPGLATSAGNRTSMVAGNSEDINFPFTTPITASRIYYSALIKVLDVAQLDLNSAIGSYGLALTSVASATTTAFQARIYTKQGATPGTFVVGVLNNSGGTAAPSFHATDLLPNTTYFLVVKYDLPTNTASLYVNPVPGQPEPTANATNATGTTAAPTQAAAILIRQAGNATAGTGNVEIDEIRVGETWDFVTPSNLNTAENTIEGLSLYPNPVKNGVFYINTTANAEKSVVVFDVLGKQVLNVTTNDSSVNVSNLRAGIYMVQVTEEGKTATKKLVIE